MKQTDGQQSTEPRFVLVIDDSLADRYLMLRMLGLEGYRVLTAGTGGEGIELFRQYGEQVKLVLLDLLMPRTDGVETLSQLRSIRPDAKIVMFTGLDSVAAAKHLEHLEARGPDAIFQKPFEPDALLAMIQELMGRPA
jgi:CheY-like chemotaxis protein